MSGQQQFAAHYKCDATCKVCRNAHDVGQRSHAQEVRDDFGSHKNHDAYVTIEQIGSVVRRMMSQEYQDDIVQTLVLWRQELFSSIDTAVIDGALWLHSNAGKDLLWHANVLPFHLARHIRDGYGEGIQTTATADEIYVLHSIDESLEAIGAAFEELMVFKETQQLLLLSYSTFTHIREKLQQQVHA